MLGSDVRAELALRGAEVLSPSRQEFDIADPVSSARLTSNAWGSLDWVVNCAAYTAVDDAESDAQAAAELNALGPAYLARACGVRGVPLLHVSTDFVFAGDASGPYPEDAATGPLSVYGRTKNAGEQSVLAASAHSRVVRTSWLFGPNGRSFPRTIIRLAKEGRPLRVVSDQWGTPTYTADLATALVTMIERDLEPGIYHAPGPESMSWHRFAELTLEAWASVAGGDLPAVQAISTSEFPTPARRPQYSVLSPDKLGAAGILPMRPIRAALEEFCRRLLEEGKPPA
jgi:dTDP-4-dehydrorhamnose reductase